MNRIVIAAAALLWCVSVSGTVCAQSQGSLPSNSEALALLGSAIDRATLRAPGGGPFVLRASVRIFQENGVSEGTYVRQWRAKGEWREEISFRGYQMLDIARGDILWERRTVPYIPLRMWQLTIAVGPPRLDLRRAKVKKVRMEMEGGQVWHCIEGLSGSAKFDLCLDSVDHRLVRMITTVAQFQARWDYETYADFGSVRLPRKIRFFDAGEEAVEVTIEEFSRPTELPAAALEPPADAKSRAWCPEPKPFEAWPLVSREPIEVNAPIWIYGRVGTSGRWKDLVLLEPKDPSDIKILDYFARQRFRPAYCGKVPIEYEMVFRLPPKP